MTARRSYPRLVPLASADAVRGRFPGRPRPLCVRALAAGGGVTHGRARQEAAPHVDAVRVNLQQDRDAVPGAAGDLGGRNPEFSHSDTAACRRS
jgi:hypothetical protein